MQQGDESDAHVQIQHKSTVSYSTLSKCLILCRYSNHTHTHTHMYEWDHTWWYCRHTRASVWNA